MFLHMRADRTGKRLRNCGLSRRLVIVDRKDFIKPGKGKDSACRLGEANYAETAADLSHLLRREHNRPYAHAGQKIDALEIHDKKAASVRDMLLGNKAKSFRAVVIEATIASENESLA